MLSPVLEFYFLKMPAFSLEKRSSIAIKYAIISTGIFHYKKEPT